MKTIFMLILTMTFSFSSKAQSDCACCTENHQQFDFWVGEWIVKDTLGKIVGENKISKIEANCILLEKWKGAGGSTGTSHNYYDKTDDTWNQLWVDNSGNVLKLKGRLESGSMVLKSDLQKGKNDTEYYNRISWTLNNDTTVTQLWEIYNKDDKVIQKAFLGIYHKK